MRCLGFKLRQVYILNNISTNWIKLMMTFLWCFYMDCGRKDFFFLSFWSHLWEKVHLLKFVIKCTHCVHSELAKPNASYNEGRKIINRHLDKPPTDTCKVNIDVLFIPSNRSTGDSIFPFQNYFHQRVNNWNMVCVHWKY